MIIENKDWRWGPDGAIEIWWDEQWLTSAQIAWTFPEVNHSATIENRFRKAIAGESRYRDATVVDLVARPTSRKKDVFLRRIDKCPKTLALLHFWAGAWTHFPFKLFLVAIDRPTCDKKLYANGLCKYCSQILHGTGGKGKLSEDGKAKLKARENSPERKREKVLQARRRLLLPKLLELQDEPLGIKTIALIAEKQYSDITKDELPKFTQLLYEAYQAQWMTKHTITAEDVEAAVDLFRIRKDRVDADELNRIRKALEAMPAKKRAKKSA